MGTSFANQYDDKNITIINKSDVPTKILRQWINTAISKMKSRESHVLVLIYDVGDRIEPLQEFGKGYLHRVLMSSQDIKKSYNIF